MIHKKMTRMLCTGFSASTSQSYRYRVLLSFFITTRVFNVGEKKGYFQKRKSPGKFLPFILEIIVDFLEFFN